MTPFFDIDAHARLPWRFFSVMQNNQVPAINTREDLKLYYEYMEQNPNQYKLSQKLIQK